MDEELLENIKALEKYDNGDDSEVEIEKIPLTVPSFKPEDIKRLREQQHITQQSLAVFLGVSTRTVQGWEIGKSNPNASADVCFSCYLKTLV